MNSKDARILQRRIMKAVEVLLSVPGSDWYTIRVLSTGSVRVEAPDCFDTALAQRLGGNIIFRNEGLVYVYVR